jgi:hypothetical protein
MAGEANLTTAESPNLATDSLAGISRQTSRSLEAIISVARRTWPSKTAVELAARGKVDVRTAERWLGRKTGLSLDALAALLRSDEGLAFLEGIVGDARPHWWLSFKRQMRMAELRRDLETQRAEIAALELQSADPSKSRR